MHLAMITAYFIEHMFGFSKKQKAGSSQMVPALLSLILIFIIQYYDVRGKSPDFDAYELFRATHSHNSTHIRISWDYHPTFMLISGRVPRSFTHL